MIACPSSIDRHGRRSKPRFASSTNAVAVCLDWATIGTGMMRSSNCRQSTRAFISWSLARSKLKRKRNSVWETGVEWISACGKGQSAQALLKQAGGTALIVMGSRSLDAIDRLTFGERVYGTRTARFISRPDHQGTAAASSASVGRDRWLGVIRSGNSHA